MLSCKTPRALLVFLRIIEVEHVAKSPQLVLIGHDDPVCFEWFSGGHRLMECDRVLRRRQMHTKLALQIRLASAQRPHETGTRWSEGQEAV